MREEGLISGHRLARTKGMIMLVAIHDLD